MKVFPQNLFHYNAAIKIDSFVESIKLPCLELITLRLGWDYVIKQKRDKFWNADKTSDDMRRKLEENPM